ncbi:MAG: hypothetical protein ACREL7_07020 [Longimicrobiales bacterium]
MKFAACLFAVAIATSPATLSAQTVMSGRLVDTAGVAVPDLDVVLHRVDEAGGARVAEGRADARGEFTLRSGEDAIAGAVYFVAARLGANLYIGPFVRSPFPTGDYMVVVGGKPANVGAATPPSMASPQVRSPASPRRWWLAILPAIGLVAVAGFAAVRARGPSSQRRLLIRIAELDLAIEGGQLDAPGERQRLVDRLLTGED